MAKPLPEAERWEDPIVAEVRKAREKLFAYATARKISMRSIDGVPLMEHHLPH